MIAFIERIFARKIEHLAKNIPNKETLEEMKNIDKDAGNSTQKEASQEEKSQAEAQVLIENKIDVNSPGLNKAQIQEDLQNVPDLSDGLIVPQKDMTEDPISIDLCEGIVVSCVQTDNDVTQIAE